MMELTERGKMFQLCIAAFIEARREAKLKGKEDDSELASKYEYATWLADAARRVSQIQAVTHVLKATHPDARGTSLHVIPSRLPQHAEIGSHVLDEDFAEDVVGNAAALDVFKFLRIEVDGKHLLDWMQADDTDLKAALSDGKETAAAWMAAFASLVREEGASATHSMAKQLYWLTGEDPLNDGQYHLLQPLFSSSLAHMVHAEIQDARFGEINKQARQAFRKQEASDIPYRDFRNLVNRKLGGTKPQNISQLNSERGGINYLLPSLPPPTWKPSGINLLKQQTVFGGLLWFGDMRELTRKLADFLASNPDPTVETREQRTTIEQDIGWELARFGVAMRGQYPAGWTRDAECRLHGWEQLWLDPDRIELPLRNDSAHPEWTQEDADFNAAYHRGEWADEVARDFGLWLNDQLRRRSDKLVALGEVEMRHFARQAVIDVAWPIPTQRHAAGGAG